MTNIAAEVTETVHSDITSAANEILEAVQNRPIISIDSALMAVGNGNVAGMERDLHGLFGALSQEHILAPYYKVDYKNGHLASIPTTVEAEKKYPVKIKLTGTLMMDGSYVNDGDPFDYAYRHQKPLVMEVRKAEKYLGEISDPYQEDVKEMEHHEVVIRPPEFPKAFACQIKAGKTVYYDNIMMRLQEILDNGTRVIGNKEQGGHIGISFFWNPAEPEKLTFNSSVSDATYKELLQYARLQKALTQEPDLHVYVIKEKEDLLAGKIDAAPSVSTGFLSIDDEVDFLQRICDIEDYFHVEFTEYGDISAAQYRDIVTLSDLTRNENVERHWTGSTMKGRVTKELRENLNDMKDIDYTFAQQSYGNITLLGAKFDLNFICYYRDARIENLQKLKRKLAVLDDGDEIQFRLIPGDDDTMVESLHIPPNLMVNPETEIVE